MIKAKPIMTTRKEIKKCKTRGCRRMANGSLGRCNMHYLRFRAHGSYTLKTEAQKFASSRPRKNRRFA